MSSTVSRGAMLTAFKAKWTTEPSSSLVQKVAEFLGLDLTSPEANLIHEINGYFRVYTTDALSQDDSYAIAYASSRYLANGNNQDKLVLQGYLAQAQAYVNENKHSREHASIAREITGVLKHAII